MNEYVCEKSEGRVGRESAMAAASAVVDVLGAASSMRPTKWQKKSHPQKHMLAC